MYLRELIKSLDWSDPEMCVNERKYEALDVLDEVPKDSEAFRIFTIIDLRERANFVSWKEFVFVSHEDF